MTLRIVTAIAASGVVMTGAFASNAAASEAVSCSAVTATSNSMDSRGDCRYRLDEGQHIRANGQILSPNNRYGLRIEQNPATARWFTQMALYLDGKRVWNSTSVAYADYLKMGDDGNLFMLGSLGDYWSSDTAKFRSPQTGPLFLRVTNEGAVQIVGKKDAKVYWQVGATVPR